MTATTDLPPSPAAPRSRGPSLEQVAGCGWFLLIALLYAAEWSAPSPAIAAPAAAFTADAGLASRACAVAFLLAQAWLMAIRPPPKARTRGPTAFLVAIAGTYGVWCVGFLPPATPSPWLGALSAALGLTGAISTLACIAHLGRSFSIAPQARALVTSGPYRLVRHPLYAAEEMTLLAVAMHVDWRAGAPFLAAHLALQIKRMDYEERLLRGAFPQYAAYAARTARWIPGLW